MTISFSKVALHRLFLFIFWLLFFLPLAVSHFEPKLEYVALLIRMPVFIVAFFDVAGSIVSNHLKKKSFLTGICILLIWDLICVLINTPSAVLSNLADAYQIVEMIVVLFYSFKCYEINGLQPLYYVSVLYILLNFVLMIFFPRGIYVSDAASSIERSQWLFGSKNNVGVYLSTFSFMVIITRTSKAFLSRFMTLLVVGISCYCIASSGSDSVAFLEGSSTGILMCGVIIFTFLFSNSSLFCSGKRQLLSPNKIIVIVCVLNIIIVGGFTSTFVFDFIFNAFHKSVTFSGRVYVWEAAIKYIKQSPFFGHGITRVVFSGSSLTSTYNTLLGIMKNYGIPAVLILILSIRSMKVSASRNVQIALFGLMTCFINGLMSQISLVFIVFFMTIAYLIYNDESKMQNDVCDSKKLQ